MVCVHALISLLSSPAVSKSPLIMITNNNNSAIIYYHTFPKPCQLLQTLIKLQNGFRSISYTVCACLAQHYLNSSVWFFVFFFVSGAMSPKSNSLEFLSYLIVILNFHLWFERREQYRWIYLNIDFINTAFYFRSKTDLFHIALRHPTCIPQATTLCKSSSYCYNRRWVIL